MAATPFLSAERVAVAFGARRVLQDVAAGFGPGQVVGLLGPNGAGKTTLLRALSGVQPLAAGRVMLNGHDLATLPPHARARMIAVVPQRAVMPEGFRVAEIVMMGRAAHIGPFGAESARDFAAAEQAMRLTDTLALAERPATQLSGGEQQRVLLARALAQEPQVLLLDEATAHLDVRHQMRVLEIARDQARNGLIVVAALHDLNMAATYAERIVLLQHGRIDADAAPRDVLTAERLARVYGVDVEVGRHPHSGAPMIVLLGPRSEL
jgi:iron complex transport system ATP-binding protein